MSNVLRLHHRHLGEFSKLTFQIPVAGHRHLRRASERWLEDESRGFVYALWKSSWQALFYHYVMALTASGKFSMTLRLFSQGDRPGKVKMKLCGERSSALRTLLRLFHVIALLYNLPLILCIHSTRTSITSALPILSQTLISFSFALTSNQLSIPKLPSLNLVHRLPSALTETSRYGCVDLLQLSWNEPDGHRTSGLSNLPAPTVLQLRPWSSPSGARLSRSPFPVAAPPIGFIIRHTLFFLQSHSLPSPVSLLLHPSFGSTQTCFLCDHRRHTPLTFHPWSILWLL